MDSNFLMKGQKMLNINVLADCGVQSFEVSWDDLSYLRNTPLLTGSLCLTVEEAQELVEKVQLNLESMEYNDLMTLEVEHA